MREHRPCTVPECERHLVARGLCNLHYHELRRGVPVAGLEARIARRPDSMASHECFILGCGARAHSKWMCKRHYSAWKRRDDRFRDGSGVADTERVFDAVAAAKAFPGLKEAAISWAITRSLDAEVALLRAALALCYDAREQDLILDPADADSDL